MKTKNSFKRILLWGIFSLFLFLAFGYPRAQASSDDPVGYWKFDETSAGATVMDYSGNNNNGTPSGNPQPSTDIASLKFTNLRSLSFDGAGDKVTVSNSSSVDISGNQVTVSAWVKTSTSQDDSIIVEKGGWGTGTYQLVLGDGGANSWPKFNISACSSPADYRTNIADGAWHHLLGMYDGAHLYIYVDGSLKETSDCTANINSNSNPLTIGARYDASGHDLNGQIDDLRIYDRALSETEIANLSNGLNDGLLAYWKLDENGGDASGNGFNLTVTSGTTYSTDHVGITEDIGSINFNGVDQLARTAGDLNGNAIPISESVWIKTTATVTSPAWILALSSDGDQSVGYANGIYLNSSGHALYYNWNGSAPVLAEGTTNLIDGQWHSIITTYDGSHMRLYVDGNQEGGDVDFSTADTWNYIPVLSYLHSGYDRYEGLMDDVRIYNRALSASDISTLSYNNNTNPTISTLTPADGATGVALDANLVIKFSEDVDIKTGNIVIKKSSDNSTVETIDVATNRVTETGSDTITINPLNNFEDSTGYYVQIDATAFDDTVGNSFAGLNDATTWNFTTGDFTSPTISSLTPSNDATGVTFDANLVIHFSEKVDVESGNITIKKVYDDSTVETIAVTSAQVTGTGTDTITINPTNDFEESVRYYVQIDATAFDDTSGNSFEGFDSGSEWNFTAADITGPSIANLNPDDDSTDSYPDDQLYIDFSETVYAGTGNITIKKASDNSTFQTIAVNNDLVPVDGAAYFYIEHAKFDSFTDYYVLIDSGTFLDSVGNGFAGISDATTWNFTTGDGDAPVIESFSPSDNAKDVAVNSNFVIKFNESVIVGKGKRVAIVKSDQSWVNYIYVTDNSQVSGTGTDTITVNPTADLDYSTDYYFAIENYAFRDLAYNSFGGFSDSSTWNFTTAAESGDNEPVNNGPTAEKFAEDIISGFITVAGGNSASTEKVTFTTDYTIIDGSSRVTIPSGTEMIKTGGGAIDFTETTLENITEAMRTAYVGNIAGAVSVGIPSLKLSFSKDITVLIPVGSEYNGQTLNVYYQNEGETNWNSGITCTVSGGECVFLTNHATSYSAGDEPILRTDEDETQEAEVDSWKAYRYYDENKTNCPQRLKLNIKGHHFTSKTKVFIGDHEASSVDKKSSKKLVAKFCLEKLLNNQADHKRAVSVKNPDTGKDKADKEIDLENLDYEDGGASASNSDDSDISEDDYYDQKTQTGARHIQEALNRLGYLDAENITSTYGQITTEAVKKFQADNGIEPTGFVGPLTKEKLGRIN